MAYANAYPIFNHTFVQPRIEAFDDGPYTMRTRARTYDTSGASSFKKRDNIIISAFKILFRMCKATHVRTHKISQRCKGNMMMIKEDCRKHGAVVEAVPMKRGAFLRTSWIHLRGAVKIMMKTPFQVPMVRRRKKKMMRMKTKTKKFSGVVLA